MSVSMNRKRDQKWGRASEYYHDPRSGVLYRKYRRFQSTIFNRWPNRHKPSAAVTASVPRSSQLPAEPTQTLASVRSPIQLPRLSLKQASSPIPFQAFVMRKLVLNHTEGVNLLELHIHYTIGDQTKSRIAKRMVQCEADERGMELLKDAKQTISNGDEEELRCCVEEILDNHLPTPTLSKVRTVDTSSFQLRKAGIWASTPFA